MIRYDFKADYYRKKEYRRQSGGPSQARDNEGREERSERMSYVGSRLTVTVQGIFWKE